MQARDSRDYDAIVLVHGIGDGERQGDFLVDVTEPLLRWVGENGGEFTAREAQSLRRGERPARLDVSGSIPDATLEGTRRDFHWRFVEARWSDEFRPPPERTALAWSRRAYPESVLDQLSYYDTVWRFWRLLSRLPAAGPAFRRLGNGPPPELDEDGRAWAYRYRVRWSLWRKAAHAAWFGLLAPLLMLAVATPVLLTLAPAWLLVSAGRPVERWARWEAAYLNAVYRLLLTLARLPLLVLGYVVLLALAVVALVPLAIPGIEGARRGLTALIRMRFADVYVYNIELVQSWSIAEAVERVIREEAARCRTLTVLAYSQGAVVAYEALSRLAHPATPNASTPMVSVREAMARIDNPLDRPGLEVRLITVGGALNRARGHALGGDARVRGLLDRPLPAGIRWVDIWALHDPVPMGSISAALCEHARVAPHEVRAGNTLTEFDAHTSYWENDVEVIATIAEELATRPPAAEEPAPALRPQGWENPARFGFWWWRARARRTVRADAGHRRRRVLNGLAALRAAGYTFVAAALLFTAAGGADADRLVADADGVPVVQTPMRWFWTPVAPSAATGETISAGDGGAFETDVVPSTDEAWALTGAGEWLGWDLVRYVAFPVILAVVASALFFVPFFAVQRLAMAAGRRLWDPPAQASVAGNDA